MDLSKLPRLSNTPTPPPDPASPSPAEPAPTPVENIPAQRPPVPGTGAEAWISLAVGALLLLIFPRFLQWASSRLFHTHFNEFLDPSGKVVPYTTLPEFWSDLGPTLFALVLIVDGLILAFARRPAAVWAAFLFNLAATAFNLIWLLYSFNRYGLPIISAMAVAFGIYIAIFQWGLIQSSRPAAPRA